MLHLRNNHFNLPRFTPSRQMVLSPISSEEDELIQAIESNREEIWDLNPAPDARSLDEFWTGVQQDLEQDPDWFKFEKDE